MAASPIVLDTVGLLGGPDQERDEEAGPGSVTCRCGLGRTSPTCTTVASMLLLLAVMVTGMLISTAPPPSRQRQSEHIETSLLRLSDWREARETRAKVFQVMAQGAESCENYPHIKLKEVQHNNLGGHGPDGGSEGIRYLAEMGGHNKRRDLLVDVHVHGDYHSTYPGGNGLSVGKSSDVTEKDIEELCGHGRCDSAMSFGTIIIHAGSSVNLTFSFFDLDYQPTYFEEIGLTWFDLDHAGCSGGPHCRPEAIESVTPMGDFEAYLTSTTHVQYRFQGEYAVFTAKDAGSGPDNPINSRLLTQEQIDKAVTSLYKSVHEVSVTLKATAGGRDATERYFFFDFVPSLLCAETLKKWPSWTMEKRDNTTAAPAAPRTNTTTSTTRTSSRTTTTTSTTTTTTATTTTTSTSSTTSTTTTTTMHFVVETLQKTMECLPADEYNKCGAADVLCHARNFVSTLQCLWWAVCLVLLPSFACLSCILCRCCISQAGPRTLGGGLVAAAEPDLDAEFPRKLSRPLSSQPTGDDP